MNSPRDLKRNELLAALPPPSPPTPTNTARKSFTFLSVGPVTTEFDDLRRVARGREPASMREHGTA